MKMKVMFIVAVIASLMIVGATHAAVVQDF